MKKTISRLTPSAAEVQEAFDRLEKMLYTSVLTAEDRFENDEVDGDEVFTVQLALEDLQKAWKGYNSCRSFR